MTIGRPSRRQRTNQECQAEGRCLTHTVSIRESMLAGIRDSVTMIYFKTKCIESINKYLLKSSELITVLDSNNPIMNKTKKITYYIEVSMLTIL